MAQISIPGGQGSPVTLTVTGNSAANLSADFAAAVHSATTVTNLSTGDESTVTGALNIISASSTTHYSLGTGRQYTYAAVTTPTQITGSSAGGDTVLGGGGITYTAGGPHDRVIFANGNNTYTGDSVGGDTISGGAGDDTINTGTGSNTIFAGSGNSLINLADTSGGDIAVLAAGNSTVHALGASDAVWASSALGSVSGMIEGGTGSLDFVSGSSDSTLPLTIVGGTGTTFMFTANGDNITFENSAGTAEFIAGAGNETLNGAQATGGFIFYGDTVAGDAASIHDSVAGGHGSDFFATGAGDETITAGSGTALFEIKDLGAGTHITIADLHASDFINFGGLSVQQERSLLSTATTAGGNLTVTLHDGTTVEFLSTTSFTGQLT